MTNKRPPLPSVLVPLSFSVLLPTGLFAQDAELSLTDILELKPNVASLLGGELTDAPATATSYTASDFERTSARNLTSALSRLQPGFYTYDHVWVTPSWGIRGIINDRNENILLNINGEMQNLLSKQGVQGETTLGLMGDYKEVQVISGPGSVIHGPGAIAGVVNVELKDGREKGAKPEELSMSFGTQGDFTGEVSRVSKFEGDRVLYVSGGYSKLDEQSNGYAGTQQEWGANHPNWHHGGRKYGGNYRFTGVFTDAQKKMRLWARYYYSQYDGQFLQEIPGAPYYKTTLPKGDPAVETPLGVDESIAPAGLVKARRHFHENLSLSADKTYALGDKAQFVTTLAYTAAHSGMERPIGVLFGRNNPPWNPGLDPRIQWENHMMDGIGEQRLRLRGDYTNRLAKHPFVLGFEARRDQYGSNFLGEAKASEIEWGNRVLYPGKVIPDKTYTNLALFTEYQMKELNPWFVLHLGGRYDKHTEFATTAPRVAITSQIQKQHSIRAVYQVAYKALSVDNINGNMEAKTIPGSDLDPSENKSTEFGYRFDQAGFNAGFVVFDNDIEIYSWDEASTQQLPGTFATQGYELSTGYKTADYSLALSYSTVQLKEEIEKKIDYVSYDKKNLSQFPPQIVRSQLWYRFSPNWSESTTIYYQGKQVGKDAYIAEEKAKPSQAHLNNVDILAEARLKLDIQLAYESDDKTTRILAGLENLGTLIDDQNAAIDTSKLETVFLTDVPRARITYVRQF